jgi:hypothetical protein
MENFTPEKMSAITFTSLCKSYDSCGIYIRIKIPFFPIFSSYCICKMERFSSNPLFIRCSFLRWSRIFLFSCVSLKEVYSLFNPFLSITLEHLSFLSKVILQIWILLYWYYPVKSSGDLKKVTAVTVLYNISKAVFNQWLW